MMKNETKSTKCRECRCTIFPSDGEQLKDMGFCSWDCVQQYEVGANYMEYNGIHR
jgi:hypothetical protein